MTTTVRLRVKWDTVLVDEGERTLSVKGRVGFRRAHDLVADAGFMVVELDNHDGRFSPGNVSSPLHGLLRPWREALVVANDGVNGWWLFSGWIESLEEDTGSGVARVRLVDGVKALGRAKVVSSYNGAALLSDVLPGLVSSAVSYGFSDYRFEGEQLSHVGQGWLPEQTSVLEAAREAVATWQGRMWIARWGAPAYRGRAWVQRASESPVLGLGVPVGGVTEYADKMTTGVDAETVVNAAQVVTYPNEAIAAQADVWAASGVMRIAPGEVERWASFSNAMGERCAAVDVVTPVPFVDYRVSEFRDGSGVDYTLDPSFSLGFALEATRAKLTFGNTATGALYVQFCKVRGKPVIEYAPVVSVAADGASAAAYSKREWVMDLPMQASDLFGQDLATYQVRRYAAPVMAVRQVEFQDRDVVAGMNVYGVEVMDMVMVTDAASGLDAARHRVCGIEYDLTPVARRVTLELERCDDRGYWRVGRMGFGELGTKTRLGY